MESNMKRILLTIISLAMLTIGAQARIGWTLEQCKAAWGAPHIGFHDETEFHVVARDLHIKVWFSDGN